MVASQLCSLKRVGAGEPAGLLASGHVCPTAPRPARSPRGPQLCKRGLGQSQGLSLGLLERHCPPDAHGGDGRAGSGGGGQARRAPSCWARCSFQVTETCPKRLLTCLKQKKPICNRTIWPLVGSAGFCIAPRSVQQY